MKAQRDNPALLLFKYDRYMKDMVFSEALKVKNGQFYDLSLHDDRINRTIRHFFGIDSPFAISDITIPKEYKTGLVKCRIEYNKQILSVDFTPYSFRNISKLKIVTDNEIDYTYKWADRSALNRLVAEKEDCDDILIIKNGLVTDTSFANVVFEDESGLYTPTTFLLNGTKRQSLLQQSIIKEREIRLEDISNYTTLHIINTMVDLEDSMQILTEGLK